MKYFVFLSISFLCSFLAAQTDYSLGPGIFEGEPYLAVNPTNTQNIVVAWMHILPNNRSIRTRASFDGGQTWNTPVDVPKLYADCADPTMAFDAQGKLFLCYINHSGTAVDTGGVYSVISTDGGLTWSGLLEAINLNDDANHQPVDRPWLVCDRSSGPHQGNLYLTTKNVSGSPAPYRPYFLKSTDGAQTWSNWRYVDSTNWLSGVPSAMAVPSVAANGTFHGIYASYVPTQSVLPRFIMASSTNAGNGFTYSQVLASLPGVSNDSAKLAWQMIADPVDANHLALVYPQGTNGDLDIWCTETWNGGTSWSTPLRVNDDAVSNGKLQDLVWASFDLDGDLVVCWRDRRNGSGTGYAQSAEIMGAVRWKDSVVFSPNFTISDQLVNYHPILAEAGNDFLSQQVVNDTLYVAWGDTRTGFLNIWFDRVALSTGNTIGLTSLASSAIPVLEVFPNPSQDLISVLLPGEKIDRIDVYTEDVRFVFSTQSPSFSVSSLDAGVYFASVYAGKARRIVRFLKN